MKALEQLSPELRTALAKKIEGMLSPERVERIDTVLTQRTRHITVVLEDIFQPHNASACLRSCECFGVQDVHILESLAKFRPNEDIAVGAAQWLTLHKYFRHEPEAQSRMLATLKERGYRLVATSPSSDAPSLDELSLDQPLAIAFGTEQTGLSKELMAAADGLVRIPMHGFTQSFNVSVSVALCLYEMTTRLRRMPINWRITETESAELRFRWLVSALPNRHSVINPLLERLV
ncbi:MAG: RNA methyltransferase [Verrucomicrobiota bacterium]|nr:RNA methyltransferase [Verrucomicrobiota bacterium]